MAVQEKHGLFSQICYCDTPKCDDTPVFCINNKRLLWKSKFDSTTVLKPLEVQDSQG